jgi:hypothetical protein
MKETGIGIRCYVTKPKLFEEAIHFRARAGTRARIDALRATTRQGDFVRQLIEEALDQRERAKSGE